MQKKEWARWRPQDASELIGDEVAFTYDLIEEAISTEGGERCFLLHGNPGRGKGCISGLIQDKFMPDAPDAVRRSYVHKGKLVTLSVAKEIMEEAAYASAYGKWRVLANEITRVTGIPIAIAKVCASNSQGDIRHALKEVQSCITANRVRKKQQRERELIHE